MQAEQAGDGGQYTFNAAGANKAGALLIRGLVMLKRPDAAISMNFGNIRHRDPAFSRVSLIGSRLSS